MIRFLLPFLLACAPKVERGTEIPAPLAARPFVAPTPQQATLSNGLRVLLVESHEVPMVGVRLAFRGGGLADPVGKEGLASVTLDLMNEGAGTYDALTLSAALKRLGSDLGTSASDDGAVIWAGGLSRNLGATLDLMAAVLLQPSFPDSEWALLQKQRTADIDRKRKDPEWIAGRVFDTVLFGDKYRRAPSKESYQAITTADAREWWKKNLTPDQAVLLAGGDTTLEALVPMLEARFKDWKPGAGAAAAPKVSTPAAGEPVVHFVDRPGAAQSIVRVGGYLLPPTDPDWFNFVLANQAVGGQFTARLNMNLREEKGWTYGARSSIGYDLAGGRFTAGAGIVTEHTVEALRETMAELAGPGGPEPLTDAEIADARSSIVLGWPLRFENPDYLLGQEEAIWRYGLPADWVGSYIPKLEAVTPASAAKAWSSRVDRSNLIIVVVGDGAVVREGLGTIGKIVEHDADGRVIGG